MFVKAQCVILLSLVLFCWLLIDGSETEDSCFCGYGGVCRFIDGKAVEWNCSDCETISGGLYENCRRLVNHCKSNPCMNNGVCVMTFGSFYCKCPPGFLGHTCNYRRTEEEKDFESVVAPRAWFQVNRVGPEITQSLHFTFEHPGDNIRFHIRYDDGRFYEIQATKLKLVNAKQECIRDVNEYPQQRDMRVCDTLRNKNVYSIRLRPRYFDSYDDDILPMKKVILSMNGKRVTEGRVNEIHIAVINMNRLTFSQVYRIHTSFELEPKCKYRISFIGCTRRKKINILHDKGKPIYLNAIREPVDNCSVGIVVETSWKLPGKPPIYSNTRNFSLVLSGDSVNPGRNYIDFLLIIRGKPPYFGAQDLSYSYARCWFKVVLGTFRVALKGGRIRVVPCITPLTLRLFSINPNYKENEFASVWRCEPATLRNCELKRFLGSKIFFRTLPCETTIYLRSMIVHLPTGNKFFLTAQVRTSIHIDALRCRCEYNCINKIDPRSKTRLWAEDVRLSTDPDEVKIEWTAKLSGMSFDIARFITSETMGRGIEIDTGAFINFEWFQDRNPVLQVRAEWKNLFCAMELEIDVPPPYIDSELKRKTRLRDVEDFRFGMTIHNVAFSKLIEPMAFEAREIISENQHETIEYIRAEFREFRYLKMNLPTYIIAKNLNGLESELVRVHQPKVKPSEIYSVPLNERIKVIKKLLAQGNFNVVVTEIMYCTRDIMVQKRYFFKEKIALLLALREVIKFTLIASTTSVQSELTKVLQIINRVTVTSELTKPPFNIDISPWIVPRRFVDPIEILRWSRISGLASSIIRTVSNHFYDVSSKDGTSKDSSVPVLLFDALLRQSISMLRQKDYHRILDVFPAGMLQYDRDIIRMRQHFDASVHYLQRAVDHLVDGYTGQGQLESGTVTFYAQVYPAHSISELAQYWFNPIQQVRVRIEITDNAITSFSSIFFSIYVEIPSREEMTTNVHICLVTHLIQSDVNATIETQMQVHKPGGNDSATDLTIAYVRNPELARERQKYITTYKIEISPDPYTNVDRQISLHIKSDVEVVLQVDPELPLYDQLYQSPARGKGSFNVSTVVSQNVLYLGLIPGQGVPPGLSRQVGFNLVNAVCAVRQPTEVRSEFSEDKIKECHIVQSKKFTVVAQITCVCPGDGIVATYRSDAVVNHVLSEMEHDELERMEKDLERGFLWIIPVILWIIFLIAWWRDKTNENREYIQSLEDTFPGDSRPYILGVYTGKRLFSSTRAKVAIQVSGISANSRVHILQSKCFKTLGRAQDDWFIFYTKEHLGKLVHIKLWQDFDKMWPDWYCSHIVIYDVEQTTWYRFPVHRRVGILSEGIENARSVTVHGVKFHPEIENMISFSFIKHYLRVLRNVHPLISLFLKHRRHIHSHRLRAISFTLLILPLMSAVIYLDDVMGHDTPETYLRILILANCSLICIGIVFFVVAFLNAMSFVKTRKTRKLDLRRVSELRAAAREHNSQEKKSIVVFMEEELQRQSSDEFLRQLASSHSSRFYKKKYSTVGREKHSVFQHIGYHEKLSEESDSDKRLSSHDIDYKKPSQDSGRKMPRVSILRRNLTDESSWQRDSPSPDRKTVISNKSVGYQSSKQSGSGKQWKPVDTTWSHQSSCVVLFKWIPDASFRPIRFDNEFSYIRFGGRGFQIAGWILVAVLILSSLSYFAYRTFSKNGYDGLHVLSITATAVAFEWLLYAPLFYLFTSSLTVFYAKLGNFECHILELGGMPANTKKLEDHIKFINEVTQPWYHPQKTKSLERLHQQYLDRKTFMLYAFFLLVLTCFLIPGVLIEWENDAYSIWRLKNSTGYSLRESAANDYFPVSTPQALETARKRIGIRKYLLSVYLPATRTTKWYNDKPLKAERGSTWFIDRASKSYGLPIIRTISASNKTRAFVPSHFSPYYEDAFNHFDMSSNYTTFISDWSKTHESQLAWPHLDRLMFHGIVGKSGLFYPQCIGKEIFLREDNRAARMFGIVTNNVVRLTRAMILEVNVIHPSFSPKPLNPAYAVTRAQILFENAAAGPYSGSVHTYLEYANGATNNLRYFTLTVYSTITIFFVMYVMARMCYEGISACFKEVRGVTVTLIAVLSLINFLLLLGDSLTASTTIKEDIRETITAFTHVDFAHHIIRFMHTTLIEVLVASLLLLLCVLLADLVNDAIGFLKKGYEKRFLLLPLLAYLLVLYFSFDVEIAIRSNGASFGRMTMLQIDKTAVTCEDCIHFLFLYTYIWIATVGITISCQSMGFERFPSDQVIRNFPMSYVCRCSRKSKNVPTTSTNTDVVTDYQEVNDPIEEERSKNTRTNDPNVADRLSRKFVLWE